MHVHVEGLMQATFLQCLCSHSSFLAHLKDELLVLVRSRIEGGVPNKGNLWDILFRAAKTLYLMNLPVDQANSGAKYEFCYVFMVKIKFLKSNFQSNVLSSNLF